MACAIRSTRSRRWPRLEFVYNGWVPNYRVPEVFARFKMTVHIPRQPYVKALPGIPTIRIFEALACGIPLVCSPWHDVEGLFNPGKDYLVVHNGDEMAAQMRFLLNEPAAAQELADHGLRTLRSAHTCAHRTDELLRICDELGIDTKPDKRLAARLRRKSILARSVIMHIAFFGSSLVSAYWNGAATYYRGILRALHEHGHSITFYEPDAYERQRHRDIANPPWARVVVYGADDTGPVCEALDEARRYADLVVKASGVGVFDELLEDAVASMRSPRRLVAFWDVDAPATLDRVQGNPERSVSAPDSAV